MVSRRRACSRHHDSLRYAAGSASRSHARSSRAQVSGVRISKARAGSSVVGDQLQGAAGDPVGLHVVGVAVAAVLVVGDDDVGSQPADELGDESGSLVEVGCREGLGSGRCCRADHAGVAVAREPARLRAEHVHRRPDPTQGLGQLAVSVRAEGVVGVPLEVGEPRRDHLALLAEGAGQHVHLVTACDVVGHRDAARQRLVVGVGVDEEEPRRTRHRSLGRLG